MRARLRLPAGARRRAGRRRGHGAAVPRHGWMAAATSGSRSSSPCPATSSRRCPGRARAHRPPRRRRLLRSPARRLLPASVACLAGSSPLAAVGLFDGVADLRGTSGAPGPGLQLGRLSGGQSYADLVDRWPAPSPLEHYWSLAIEEQFYWVWPVVLVVVLRAGRRSPPPVGAPTVGGRGGTAHRRRVGRRRRLLGDAGPPRRDPRRGAAGRRPHGAEGVPLGPAPWLALAGSARRRWAAYVADRRGPAYEGWLPVFARSAR